MSKQRCISIQQRRWRTAIAVPVIAVALAGCARVPGIYTYEGQSQVAQAAAGFDATKYVDGIWSSKVQSTVHSKAVDITTVLDAIAADPTAAAAKYGRTSGVGSPAAFLVKGSGTVTKVDTTSPIGPVTVTLTPPTTPAAITLLTGPVIAGTAVRDAVGFISFGQFPNQIDYADVATRLNDHVKDDVVAKVDRASLTGKQVTFEGAFTLLTPSAISVVPTSLTVAS